MQESSAVDSVLSAMLSIGRLMRQRSGREALEPGTFWLLNSLRCTGEMRVTELAAKLLLDASTVSRHVQQLEKAGLVERTTDPQDKRAQIVGLSADGRGILEAGLARRKATLVEHFTDWDQHDIDTLERLLNKLVQTIENSDGAQPVAFTADTDSAGPTDTHSAGPTDTHSAIDPTETTSKNKNNSTTNTSTTAISTTDRPVAELEHQ